MAEELQTLGAEAMVDAPVTLEECERTIERGIATFVEVGQALRDIRDHGLWMLTGVGTFEEYCDRRWGFGYSYAAKQIDAVAVAEVVSPKEVGDSDGRPGLTEWQLRPLVPLLRRDGPDAVRAVWEGARGQADGDLPSARDVERYLKGASAPELESASAVLRKVTAAIDRAHARLDAAEHLLRHERGELSSELSEAGDAAESLTDRLRGI